MKVTSSGIVNGVMEDRFGKRGTQFVEFGGAKMFTYSLPLKIEDAPAGTRSFAIFMEDKDAVPVVGFSFIHWLVADLERTELAENESVTAADFVQGTSSWSGALRGMDRIQASVYAGPGAPDKPHTYEIHVYALDKKLGLPKGFYMNELYWAMEGHVLEEYTLRGVYLNER